MHSLTRRRNRWDAITPAERFESKCEPIPIAGCVIWTGASVPFGYGVIRFDGRQQYAHRVAWQLGVGQIPDGMSVLHRCDTPSCVAVHHLFLGTLSDNTQDMLRKGRGAGGPPKGDRNPMRLYRGLLSGDRNGNAKLTWPKIRDIRRSYESGETQVSIAARHGVGQAVISRIVRREAWV